MVAKVTPPRILIINGPNLNLLGLREPDIYGSLTWPETFDAMKSAFSDRAELSDFQSNCEGTIIDRLHDARTDKTAGIVLNAGAYSHYSYAIADALAAIDIPVVEVHISNTAAREEFRHTSVIAPKCAGSIIGFGIDSYRLAIEALLKIL